MKAFKECLGVSKTKSKIYKGRSNNEAGPTAELSYVAGTHWMRLDDIEVLHQQPGGSYENHIKFL